MKPVDQSVLNFLHTAEDFAEHAGVSLEAWVDHLVVYDKSISMAFFSKLIKAGVISEKAMDARLVYEHENSRQEMLHASIRNAAFVSALKDATEFKQRKAENEKKESGVAQ